MDNVEPVEIDHVKAQLIEVINDFFGCDAAYFDVNPLDLATHLIANGVTFAKDIDVPSKWIPVTERLPQDDLPFGALCEIVQVLLDDGAVTVGWCNRGLKCWYYMPIQATNFVGHDYDKTPVIAWQPLAQPPKEGV